ncbi:MAG: AMP-binding protein [Gammaproteobacteria bacterium]|nr:AMP-binding protein [Gammaproteobacteria bacterium]
MVAKVLTYPHFEPHFPRDQWTLPNVLEHQARVNSDRPCLSWGDAGKPLSFAEVNAISNRLARGFQDMGVGKGDFVVLFLPNCLEYIFAWYALSKLGAVEVTVGNSYKGELLRHQVDLSKARLAVSTPELAGRLADIEEQLGHIEHCILVAEDERETQSVKFNGIGVSNFSELYRTEDANLGVDITPRDTAAVLFTSGTTGLSKGVLMSHSQFYFFAEEDVQLVDLKDDDVYSTSFPLFHGNAQFLTVYPSLIAGAHCVLYERFSASDFMGRIRRSGSTVCNLLGATMAFILAQPPSDKDKEHRLRRIYSAPLAPDLGVKFTERFGVSEFVDGFGQTEISNVFMTPRGATRPPGASGVLVDQFFEIRLADPETDEDVPEGEIGELQVRHKLPYIMCDGYLNMPEKTVETWRNLWFHTGDVMRRDEQGWYYFVDRVKDALRRRGENISSFEVESVVRTYPAVAECAVVAAPADEPGGEDEVKTFIVLKEGEDIDMAELIDWCDSRMPSFMVPRYVEIIDELPQTPSEKVRKKDLREMGNSDRTWDRVEADTLCPVSKTKHI